MSAWVDLQRGGFIYQFHACRRSGRRQVAVKRNDGLTVTLRENAVNACNSEAAYWLALPLFQEYDRKQLRKRTTKAQFELIEAANLFLNANRKSDNQLRLNLLSSAILTAQNEPTEENFDCLEARFEKLIGGTA